MFLNTRYLRNFAILILMVFSLTACGDDDSSADSSNQSGWQVGDSADQNSEDSPSDTTDENNDSQNHNDAVAPHDGDTADDPTSPNEPSDHRPDDPTSPNDPSNNQPDDAGNPNNDTNDTIEPDPGDTDPVPPEETLEDTLVGDPWYGTFRLTDTPAISGFYLSLTFHDDGTVDVTNDKVRSGKWTVLENGDVHLYELEKLDPTDAEQFLLIPKFDDGRLISLELVVPAWVVSPYRLSFERQHSDQLIIQDLEGRWQADQIVITPHGPADVAVRVDNNGLVEVGVIAQDNFHGFATGLGLVHEALDGRSYWAVLTTAGQPRFAGEIQVQNNELVLYIPIEVVQSSGQKSFEAIPLYSVEQFASN